MKPKLTDEGEEDTVFEQMKRKRLEHEQILREEDAKRAAEDPNYKPRFKQPPKDQQDDHEIPDANYEVKRRLAEERRKHHKQVED